MMTIAEFQTAEQLQNIRPIWDELFAKTKQASFFQSFDWFVAAQQQFAHNESALVLLVSLAGKPIGILPLVVQKTATSFGTIRRLTDAPANWTAFTGSIGPNPTATLTAAMRHLRQSRRQWDVIDFQHVDLNQRDQGRTANALKIAELRSRTIAHSYVPTVEMNSAATNSSATNSLWDDYWNSRPENLQEESRRAEQRITAFGDIRFLRYRPQAGATDLRWDLFSAAMRSDAISLHSNSGQHRPAMNSAQQAVLSDAHHAAVSHGMLDLNLLYINDRPVASAYNFCNANDGTIEGIRHGYAVTATPDAATVLLRFMLKDSFQRGDTCYRFPVGDQYETCGWANNATTQYRLTHYPFFKLRSQLAKWFDRKTVSPAEEIPISSYYVPSPPQRQPVTTPEAENRDFAIVG